MPHHHHRRLPRQRGLRVAVQVHDVGAEVPLQLQQPIPRAPNVLPRVLHPLQAVLALVDVNVVERLDLRPLVRPQRRPHGRQRDLDAVRAQRPRQLERVGPHAADRVCGEQELYHSSHRDQRLHEPVRPLLRHVQRVPQPLQRERVGVERGRVELSGYR